METMTIGPPLWPERPRGTNEFEIEIQALNPAHAFFKLRYQCIFLGTVNILFDDQIGM